MTLILTASCIDSLWLCKVPSNKNKLDGHLLQRTLSAAEATPEPDVHLGTNREGLGSRHNLRRPPCCSCVHGSRLGLQSQAYSKAGLMRVTQKPLPSLGQALPFMSCLVKRAFKNQDNLSDADSIYPSAQLHAPQDQRKVQVCI